MQTVTRGVWEFDPRTLVIRHRTDEYEVDLERCVDSASILDWFAQVDQKEWITSTDLGDLVRLMNELLSFQQHYCGCEVDRTADPVAILESRLGRRLQRTRRPRPDAG